MSSTPALSSAGAPSPDLSSTGAFSPDLDASSVSASISSLPSSCDLTKSISESGIPVLPHSPRRLPPFLTLKATPKNTQPVNDPLPCPPRSAPALGLRFSPTISGLAAKATDANRTRANSLTNCSLAERRRSKTSAYLSSDDFKQNFASKLRSVKAREQSEDKGIGWTVPNLGEDEPPSMSPSESECSFDRNCSEAKVSEYIFLSKISLHREY